MKISCSDRKQSWHVFIFILFVYSLQWFSEAFGIVALGEKTNFGCQNEWGIKMAFGGQWPGMLTSMQ